MNRPATPTRPAPATRCPRIPVRPRPTRDSDHPAPGHTPASRRSSDAGLTLIEMVVAIGVVVCVLIASLSVFITVAKSQRVAEGTDRAIQLANSKIERIRELDWPDIGFYQTVHDAAIAADSGYGGTNANDITFPGPATGVSATPANCTAQLCDITPSQTVVTGYTFTVRTYIRWANSAPHTTALADGQWYDIKDVKVVVSWQTSGTSGGTHTVTDETWFAPDSSDEVPPGITTTS